MEDCRVETEKNALNLPQQNDDFLLTQTKKMHRSSIFYLSVFLGGFLFGKPSKINKMCYDCLSFYNHSDIANAYAKKIFFLPYFAPPFQTLQ